MGSLLTSDERACVRGLQVQMRAIKLCLGRGQQKLVAAFADYGSALCGGCASARRRSAAVAGARQEVLA